MSHSLLATTFIGGALADTVDRRRMIRLTQVALCLASGVLVLNSLLGQPQLWLLSVGSVVMAGAAFWRYEGREGEKLRRPAG